MNQPVIPADVANLALHEDLDIVALSDEQCAVLWRDDAAYDGRALSPVLAAGLRALVASGLVDIHDGAVRTHGPATLVRRARTESRRVLIWTPEAGSPRPPLVWIVLTERLLLQQCEKFPGVYQFTLREVRRAATELASELAFDVQVPTVTPIEWTQDAAVEMHVGETLAQFPVASELVVLDSGPFVGSESRTSTVLHQMIVRSGLVEDRGPVWGIHQDPGTTPVVAPMDRRSLRRWVLDSIAAPNEDKPKGSHGATS